MSVRTTCCGCWSALLQSLDGKRRHGGRTYRRAKYNEREYSIEFENLIEEEDFYAPPQHAVSQIEKDLLSKGKYDEFLQHQSKIDMEKDAMLQKNEEDAKLEDEAYIQAKREASRVSRQGVKKAPFDKARIPNMRTFDSVEFSKWLSEEKIDITSPELDIEDFDAFLEKVKAKSAQAIRAKNDTKEDMNFERTLSQGLEATKIAGDALNALQPVELHAVGVENEVATPEVSFSIPNQNSFDTPVTTVATVNTRRNIAEHLYPEADTSQQRESTPWNITGHNHHEADASQQHENTPRNVAELEEGESIKLFTATSLEQNDEDMSFNLVTPISSEQTDDTTFKLVTPKERQMHSINDDSEDEDDFISANSEGGFEELLT